jgi:hypothetical protein
VCPLFGGSHRVRMSEATGRMWANFSSDMADSEGREVTLVGWTVGRQMAFWCSADSRDYRR